MSSTPFFEAIGAIFQFGFKFYDWVGDKLNYSFILLGFFGLFYWLNTQRKFNNAAENNPDTLK